ncbi:MAG: hypothetical protein WCI74_07430 [Actinomycetes bacterium]
MTKLSASLPEGTANGLGLIAVELAKLPDVRHVAIVVLDCKQILTDVDSGAELPTARIRRIEVIKDPAHVDQLEDILRAAHMQRHGVTHLPVTEPLFDTEPEREPDDIADDFDHVARRLEEGAQP